MFFVPLFGIEAITLALVALSPLTRLSRQALLGLALMLALFAIWALTGFGYPLSPVPITLNVLSKLAAFAAVAGLFLQPGPVASAPETGIRHAGRARVANRMAASRDNGRVSLLMQPGPPARYEGRRAITAAVLAAVAVAGCSVPGLPSGSSPSPSPTGSTAGSSASSPAPARPGFTVRGSVPVTPTSSQDSHAQSGGTCPAQQLRRYQTLGQAAVISFTSTGAPTAATLLSHFLAGSGTAVRFGTRSQVATEVRASRVFRTLNTAIQSGVLARLRAGQRHVQVTGSELTPPRFGSRGSRDLYLGFRGTQGLTIRGSGRLSRGRYAGHLTYVIRDSYGFSAADRLLGVGTAMRYLQTTCGHPPVSGGAHWFPDSVTVIVPFRHRR